MSGCGCRTRGVPSGEDYLLTMRVCGYKHSASRAGSMRWMCIAVLIRSAETDVDGAIVLRVCRVADRRGLIVGMGNFRCLGSMR
jgi:hypothetical protein